LSETVTCPRCNGTGEVVLTLDEQIAQNRAESHAQQEALRKGAADPNALNDTKAVQEAAKAEELAALAQRVQTSSSVSSSSDAPALDAAGEIRVLALDVVANGYEVDVEYDAESGKYVATIPELSVTLHADTIEDVLQEAESQIAMVGAKPETEDEESDEDDDSDEDDEETDDEDESEGNGDTGSAQSSAADQSSGSPSSDSNQSTESQGAQGDSPFAGSGDSSDSSNADSNAASNTEAQS
jgi:predicted RNase H-like HicB family nuclease